MEKYIQKLEQLKAKTKPWIEDYQQIHSEIGIYLERLKKDYFRTKTNEQIERDISNLEGKLNSLISIREKKWEEFEREKKELGVE